MARFALNQLREHECLVLETLCKKQSLFIWKAVLYELKETDPDESRIPDTLSWNVHRIFIKKELLPHTRGMK